MQKGQRDALGLKDSRGSARGGDCLHGGWLQHGYCRCVPGWTGDRCQRESFFEPYKQPAAGDGAEQRKAGEDVCGEEVVIFPYNDAAIWGTAFVGWEDCSGSAQSPIDICAKASSVCPQNKFKQRNHTLRARYVPSASNRLVNNGHNLDVANSASNFGTLRLKGKTFTAQSFHFHTPSEHTVDGEAAAMEMHIVHKAGDGSTAVVGVLFKIGKENECLKTLPLDPQAPQAGCGRDFGKIDLGCFEDQLSGPWWSYNGSLTTPPCTEGVAWSVMAKRATVSMQQLKGFESAHRGNARPVQSNGATVTLNRPSR